MRSRLKEKGKVAAGTLSVSITAPWQGYLRTVLFHTESVPSSEASFTITHQESGGDTDYETEIFGDDPNDSNLNNETFSVPVTVEPGDTITAYFDNPDNVPSSIQITLEGI